MRHWAIVAVIPLLLGAKVMAADDLVARFDKLSRAVVRIETSRGIGTGFFVNSTGRLVTAAHVVFDRSFVATSPQPMLQLNGLWPANAVFYDGTKKPIPAPTSARLDFENAVFDLAVIETGFASPDFIPLGKADDMKIGASVIAIGFPGSANSGVLYAGFISSKHTNVPTVVGPVQGKTQSVSISRDVMRIQMPITAGASGSPLINDADEVVGVVSEIPVQWTSELTRLVSAIQNSPGGSGVSISGFDTTAILGQLALIVREFESPGAGIAVPANYLKLPPATPTPKP